jgi:hypothetical protein
MMSRVIKRLTGLPNAETVAREKLRAAQAERDRAKAQLAKARQRAEELRGVIDSIDAAEAEVERLEASVKQAGIDWAQSGADPLKAPPSERKLLAELREARNDVEERRRRAEGAAAVFGVDVWDRDLGRSTRQDTTPDEVAAQTSLSGAESQVKSCIRDVMVAAIEATLHRLKVLHDEYVELYINARALHTALRRGGNYAPYSTDDGSLEQRLRALSISLPLDRDVVFQSQDWRDIVAESEGWQAFGRALATDPDAPAPV